MLLTSIVQIDDARKEGFSAAREKARDISWCHYCDERCKDIGFGPHCTMTIANDIRALKADR